MIRDFYDTFTRQNRGCFLVVGDTIYVGRGTARQAIEFIGQHNGVILGLEGFNTDGSQLEPLIDYIADFGSELQTQIDRAARSADFARRALDLWEREGRPEFIEFVIDGPEE